MDGIFTLLDDEMRFSTSSSQDFSQKVENIWKSHPAFILSNSKEQGFLIRHFARDVIYSTVS